MKLITILLVFLISYVTNAGIEGFDTNVCSDYESKYPAFSLDFCRTTLYDEVNERCCFLQYEDNGGITRYHCKRVSMKNFWEIDDYIDALEANNTNTIADIEILDCHSSYLFASLIFIFALIF